MALSTAEVIAAWNNADPAAIHPSRSVAESVYWESGKFQAGSLSHVLPQGCSVLDFGCGDGRVALPLSDLGYRVTGVDSSPRMLAALNHRAPDIPTIEDDGSLLREKLSRPVAAALCLAVLIHHSYAAGGAIVTALTSVVRKGGLLVLNWPTSTDPGERTHWLGVTTWDAEQKNQLARGLGLEAVDTALPWSVYRKTN